MASSSPSQLSFLPDDYLERKAQRRTNLICAVLFLLVISGLISAFTMRQKARRNLDALHKKVDEEFVREAHRIEQVKVMQENQKRMARQADLTASLLEKVARSYILAEITNALPKGTSLLDFSLAAKARAKPAPAKADKGTAGNTDYERRKAAREKAAGGAAAAAQAAPQATTVEPRLYDVTMKLTGIAPSNHEVAAFFKRLADKARLFQDVSLVISEEATVEDQKVRKFQFELVLSPDAEAQPPASYDPEAADDEATASTATTTVERN